MKILHLATFIGNIGDNASHIGLKNILPELLGDNVQIDELEIRKTYSVYTLPDKWSFNDELIDRINGYDLLLIGGGHFLDFWLPNSPTGTALEFDSSMLSRIDTPIMITSTGCMPRNNVPKGNVEKLRRFLSELLERDNVFIGVRNDGSRQVLLEDIGQHFSDAIPEVLDHGFFYDNDGQSYRASDKPYVVINSTLDQLNVISKGIGQINEKTYLSEMASVIDHLFADY